MISPLLLGLAPDIMAKLDALIPECQRLGCDVALELSSATARHCMSMTVDEAKLFRESLRAEMELAELRRLAQGRPLAKVEKITRDEKGEMVEIITSYRY